MAGIELADIVYLAITTVAACYQMATFAMKVGEKRRKFKLEPPSVDGDPEFVRAFRAQQNCVEFFGVFLACLWVSGLFFHQIPAALVGMYYMYGRQKYVTGYIEHAKARIPGFKICQRALYLFLAMTIVGLGHYMLQSHAGINIKNKLFN